MNPRKEKSLAKLLWIIFAAFIVYGTALPFRFHMGGDYLRMRAGKIDWFPLLTSSLGAPDSGDWLQNLLLFIPFGFLGYVAIADKQARWKPYAVTALGLALSAGVEFLQLFSETRFTAFSDVLLNTLGTGLGVRFGMGLRGEVFRLNSRPLLRRLLDAEPAYPALLFLLIASAGAWMPFDFALSWKTLWAKIQYLPDTFHFPDFASGDLLTFSRYACFSYFVCRLFRTAGFSGGRMSGALCTWGLGLFLEAGQYLVRSQCPDFKGALILTLGITAGLGASFLPSFRSRPLAWGTLITVWFASAIAFANVYPFHFTGFTGGINWIPFLPQNPNPSFFTLSGFLQEATAYSSVGVMWAYLLPKTGAGKRLGLYLTLGFALASGVLMEILRRGLPGGIADMTWLLGALTGAMAGWLLLARGWPMYWDYVRLKAPEKNPNAATDSNRNSPQ